MQKINNNKITTTKLAEQIIQDPINNLIKIESIKKLGEGFDNVVFLVNNKYVFRFPKHTESETLMIDENHILPTLQKILPLNIPNLIYFGKPTKSYDFSFHGYELLQGESAYKTILSETDLQNCLKQFAIFLKKLHSIKSPQAQSIGAKNQLYDKTTVKRVIESLENRIAVLWQNNVIEKNEDIIKNKIELSKKIKIIHDDDCLVHGDLDFRHILIKNKKLSGIIDWSDIGINNPVVDFVVIHQMFPQSMHEIFFEIYGNISQDIWSYARFLALHRSVTLMLFGYDQNDTKMLNAAKKSYLQIINS